MVGKAAGSGSRERCHVLDAPARSGDFMSELKKPRSPKKENDLSAMFKDKATEAEFHKWVEDNSERIDDFRKSEAKELLWVLSEFWYDRVNKAWGEAIELIHEQGDLLRNVSAAIPEARKQGHLAALLSHWDAIRAKEQRLLALAEGRSVGSKSQKQYAAETDRIVLGINADLLKNPNCARWGLDRRASYIEQKLLEQKRKQPNGKPYKASTIKTKITGKG